MSHYVLADVPPQCTPNHLHYNQKNLIHEDAVNMCKALPKEAAHKTAFGVTTIPLHGGSNCFEGELQNIQVHEIDCSKPRNDSDFVKTWSFGNGKGQKSKELFEHLLNDHHKSNVCPQSETWCESLGQCLSSASEIACTDSSASDTRSERCNFEEVIDFLSPEKTMCYIHIDKFMTKSCNMVQLTPTNGNLLQPLAMACSANKAKIGAGTVSDATGTSSNSFKESFATTTAGHIHSL